MATLSIKTSLNSVVVVGEFCEWDIDSAKRIDREKGAKHISVKNMPQGEYRVLSCPSFLSGEVYPTDGRQMSNRYFSGEENEKIVCYFSPSDSNKITK